ncbi:ATP-binding protein [uncultured Alistipes sp.]|uniref:sensor histidine kinase n=1 Tax=uncultured Alistipes sp. TaxID=538949 RepID=UPI0026297C0A|nr:ATP-binding protein [uncultured Alistipes sp.]
MITIKTKEAASCWIGLLATVIVAGVLFVMHAKGVQIRWIVAATVLLCTFSVVMLVALFIIRKYVAYKLKPIYSIVLSRNVHTEEIFSELKDKKVENIGEELTAWADTNDKEIARLKEAERFRKQYLGNVAHELKTPIFNIQGYISTLLDGGLEDELINRKYLERAEKSIDRLINIVNDLDTISKLESNMNQLKMERFDIVALAKEIAEQAEMEADKRGIRVSVKGAENLPSPFWVVADKHYIGQVLVNLIINSIHYGKENGSTRIRFRDLLDRVLVEVEDNGQGIAKEDLPRVFERFYRTDKGRSREQGGTGLGLAIVKHIVEAHGERITVRSELGAGSTFSFTLKKADPHDMK